MCSGGVALEGDLQGGWDVHFQCYQDKFSIFQISYYTFKCWLKHASQPNSEPLASSSNRVQNNRSYIPANKIYVLKMFC